MLEPKERTILHVNVVNFYISVARAQDRAPKGRPVAVTSIGAKRRTVLDCSTEAQETGVCKGMSIESAKRFCPDLILIDPSPQDYDRASSLLIEKASHLSPLAEPAGPGHLFVDLTGTRRLLGPENDVADRFRKNLNSQCNLNSAVGIASSRLVSKIATRVIKPSGLCTVIPGCEEEFMAPLPLVILPGVEKKIVERLLQFNMKIIRQLQTFDPKTLARALGSSAFELVRSSRGIDTTPVRETVVPAPTIKETATLDEQTNDQQVIAVELFSMVSRCGAKLRKAGLAAGILTVSVTYADGSVVTRSVSLPSPLQGDLSIYEQCSIIVNKLITRRVRLSQIAFECSNLTFPYGQADLFVDNERECNLMGALDVIRSSFGDRAIQFWGRERIV